MNYYFQFNSKYQIRLRGSGITVYSLENFINVLNNYNQDDSYKIILLSGSGMVTCSGRSVAISDSALLVTKPNVSCSWILEGGRIPSFVCLIAREFFNSSFFNWVSQSDLFSSDEPRVYSLTSEQFRFLRSLFQKMIDTQKSDYTLKAELIQDQICVMLHTALRLRPSDNYLITLPTLFQVVRYVEFVEMMFPPKAQVIHLN